MRIGEAPAAEIGHGIGLAPDDVVEDPEAEILQDRADAENIVIGADDEDRRVRLHRALRGGEPVAGEAVVIGEGGELVPVVVHRVHFALVGPGEAAFELKIIGRIGEDQIDAGLGQAAHGLDAVADQDLVERRRRGESGANAPSSLGTGLSPVRDTSFWTLEPAVPARRILMNLKPLRD